MEVWSPTTDRVCFQLEFTSSGSFSLNVTLSSGNAVALRSTTNTVNIFGVQDVAATHIKLITNIPLGYEPNSTSLAQMVIYTLNGMVTATGINTSDCVLDDNSEQSTCFIYLA
jgi:hypothetical protein